MQSRQIILAGILIIALLSCTGTVVALGNSATAAGDTISGTPDTDPVGPESPLFGLKVAMEDLDETFTFNDTQRVEKQVFHAQARIEEVRRELERNRSVYAERGLELYSQKLNQTEMSLPRFQSGSPGLLHVQELVSLHQTLLSDLMSRFQGSASLARAYNNNLALGQKFEEKTRMRFERVADKNNKTVLKAVKIDTGKPETAGAGNSNAGMNPGQEKNETPDQVKDKKNATQVTLTETSPNPAQSDEKGSLKNQGKNGHN